MFESESYMQLFFAILKGIWGHINLTLMGIILATLRKIGGEKAEEFNRIQVSSFFCKQIIKPVRMKIEIYNADKYQDEQCIYMYNHNSYFDIFILPLIKLKNTKYIFTEKSAGILGLKLANYGNGALLLPSKINDPTPEQLQKRESKFEEFTKLLKSTETSILTAPEGQHTFEHKIDKFNDGVFKMAMNSKVKIVPIFINIKKENNPFQGYKFKPGTIKIEFLDAIETKDWRQENLESHVQSVRQIFVDKFNKEHKTSIV